MQGWQLGLVVFALTVVAALLLAVFVTRKRRGVFEGDGARDRARSASAVSLGGSMAVARIPSSRPSASERPAEAEKESD